MGLAKKILDKLQGSCVEFKDPLDLSQVGKTYLINRITIEPGNHIIGHFGAGKMLSINNCALWQMQRVLTRLGI